MKISVVIPCYKQAEFLAQSIESVLEQTEKPHEVIVIDDGSPDNSFQVAQSYPVKLIRQVNKGLASARNTGIMNSTGDYIFPLDSDDAMLGNCIERISQVIQETDADIIAPSFKEFGVRNRVVKLTGNPTIEDFGEANRIGYFSAIRKSKLLEVGGYNPKMVHGYEDWDLWFDLLKRGAKLVTIQDILLLYRTKEDSMLTDAVKHHDELVGQIRKNHPELFRNV